LLLLLLLLSATRVVARVRSTTTTTVAGTSTLLLLLLLVQQHLVFTSQHTVAIGTTGLLLLKQGLAAIRRRSGGNSVGCRLLLLLLLLSFLSCCFGHRHSGASNTALPSRRHACFAFGVALGGGTRTALRRLLRLLLLGLRRLRCRSRIIGRTLSSAFPRLGWQRVKCLLALQGRRLALPTFTSSVGRR
jgi:hypothetical protein